MTTNKMREEFEAEKPYNPWREFIENCASGDNFFRSSDYDDLLEYIDGLLAERNKAATRPAPVQVPEDEEHAE